MYSTQWVENVGNCSIFNGPLTRCVKLRVAHAPEIQGSFSRHRLQIQPPVSDPGTLVPWCMSGSLTRGSGENVPGITGACATHTFTYLVRGPCFDNPWWVVGMHENALRRETASFQITQLIQSIQNLFARQYNSMLSLHEPHLSVKRNTGTFDK